MESLTNNQLVNLLSQFNISQEGIAEFQSKPKYSIFGIPLIIYYFMKTDLEIDGHTFTWLEAEDIKSIFSKMSDQLKIKAMLGMLRNSRARNHACQSRTA
jgi:hypothetical protein